MNDLINQLKLNAGIDYNPDQEGIDLFAELMTTEFVDILEHEIKLVKEYKEQSFNDRDREWHEGKIVHFHKLIDKTKKRFGVEE